MLQPYKTTSKIIVLYIFIFIFRQQTGIENCVEQLIAGLRLQWTNSSTCWESKIFRLHPILSLCYVI